MGGRRGQRPGAGRAGAGRPARPAADSGKAKANRPPRPAANSGKAKANRTAANSGRPEERRLLRALNPRKPPSKSRVRLAALVFAALTIVLGVLGFTVNGGYLRSAALTAILALLWGAVSLTMR